MEPSIRNVSYADVFIQHLWWNLHNVTVWKVINLNGLKFKNISSLNEKTMGWKYIHVIIESGSILCILMQIITCGSSWGPKTEIQ